MIDIIEKAKANIILDASKIDLFETCPARYDYRYNQNKVLGGAKKAEALDKGSLAHSGFETYFTLLAEQKHFDDRIAAMRLKMSAMAADPENSDLEPEDVELLISAVEQSCDYWRSEDENSVEVLAVEQPFAYVLFEDDAVRIIITGKIDLLTNFNGIGRAQSYKRLPFDHKTFSRDSQVLRKSNQFINYCNAVGSDYLIVNRVGLQKTLSAEQKFKRIPLSYDPIYIQEWKDNLTKMLLQEYLTCVAEGYWPMKPTSCNKFNRLCEYYRPCDCSGEEARKFILENEYVEGEVWDVTKEME